MGEHDAKKWGRAPTRLHGITFHIPKDIMMDDQCCGSLEPKKKKKTHYIYIKLEFTATMDQRNCV